MRGSQGEGRPGPAALEGRGVWSVVARAVCWAGVRAVCAGHHGEVQRRLLQVVGVVRVGAVLEQAADLRRVKRADVMGYHAQRAGDALPLGYGTGQVTHTRGQLRVRASACRS